MNHTAYHPNLGNALLCFNSAIEEWGVLPKFMRDTLSTTCNTSVSMST
jgi:hypothetical protein